MTQTKRDTVLFDLDGTLLPLDMDAFMQSYMQKLLALDIGPHAGLSAFTMQQGFYYMMSDAHPSLTNRDAFFTYMKSEAGVPEDVLQAHLLRFYNEPFDSLKTFTRVEPVSADIVKILKEKGYRLVLATNPVFPGFATDKRIAWAGLNKADFDYITTFENSHFAKPHLNYYREILSELALTGNQCYMVGNSIKEDLCALSLGLEVFLLTDYLIGDIDEAPICKKGNYSDLRKWAASLPPV